MEIIFKKHLTKYVFLNNKYIIEMKLNKDDEIFYEMFMDCGMFLSEIYFEDDKWTMRNRYNRLKCGHLIPEPHNRFLLPKIWLGDNCDPSIIVLFENYQDKIKKLLEFLNHKKIVFFVKSGNKKLIQIILILRKFKLPHEIVFMILKFITNAEILY